MIKEFRNGITSGSPLPPPTKQAIHLPPLIHHQRLRALTEEYVKHGQQEESAEWRMRDEWLAVDGKGYRVQYSAV